MLKGSGASKAKRTCRHTPIPHDAEVRRFDLSDLLPPALGSTNDQGLFEIFQDFLRDPSNVEETADRLEEVALVAELQCG